MDTTSLGTNETSFTPFVLLPVVLSSLWILWDLFYASYFLAFLVQCIVNLYLKDTKIYIGQLRLNLVTGRLIFKDIEIYRRDDSIRVADGYGVLRWWAKPNLTDDEARCERCSFQSHACANKKTSLVYLYLNGFEYHWYHRSDIYDAWGQTKINEYDSDGPAGSAWLIGVQPSVHCTINKGQLVFGSQLVENNLVVCFTQAEGQYAVTQASNPYDELMHLVKFHGDNVKAFLQPVDTYSNRTSTSKFELFDVNDGFIVLKTDFVECVYSLDIPGLVPIDDTTSPKYSFDIQLGTNTFGKYGTYVNNQRVILQKHFFPNDYTVSQVDRPRQPGERRVYTSFDVSISVTSPATLNFEFQGKSDAQCLSFTVSGASQLLIHQPWVIKDDGYTTKFTGKLMGLAVFTNLPFKPLGKAHCVNLSSSLHFPRVWNSTQAWDMKFSVDQPQINILFPYIDFFNELLDDWVQSDAIDILDFVPFQWHIGVDMSNYEIFLFTNRYNWIDTDEIENERIAFCGKTGHLSLDLPFTEFLPDRQQVIFNAHGKNIVVRRYFSPSSVSKESVFALSSVHKKRWRIINPSELQPVYSLTRSASQPIKPYDAEVNIADHNVEKGATTFKKAHRRRGSEPLVSHSQKYIKHDFDCEKQNTELQNGNESYPMGCCSTTFYKDGWLDICCGPEITINITYNGHNSDMSHVGSSDDMVPSQVLIDINAPQVLLRVFGTLARDLLSLKENYPGEYMYFKTYSSRSGALPDCLSKTKDATDSIHSEIATDERFLEVIVNFKLQSVTGEFPTHYPENFCDEFPLPSAHSECLSVYVEYKRRETIVKLTVDPVTIHLPFLVDGKEHKLGVVALSGVTFCCHGLTEILLKERVEYAWMMKLNIGDVSASVSLNELLPVVQYFLTALSHIITPADDVLEAPDCLLIKPLVEPCSELLKYKLFVLEVATIDLILKEADTMLQIQTAGFGIDLCNLHQDSETVSLSVILKCLNVSFLMEIPECLGVYCECACFDVGTIEGDFSLREPLEADSNKQKSFLKQSDSSHRLWFLWDNRYTCGCCGGCQFLDGFISREDFLPVSHSSRYFAKDGCNPIINRSPRSLPQIPLHLSIDNVPSLESLHSSILKYYGFAHSQLSDNMNLQEHDDDELVSHDSEASFDTAKSSFHSESFSGDEHFASLQNSPSGSMSAAKVDYSDENNMAEKKKDNSLSLYWQILDKYLCCNNLLQLNCKKLQKSVDMRSVKNKSQGKAIFTIDFPEIIESNVGVLPYVCYSAECEVPTDSNICKESGQDSGKKLSTYVVSVTLIGNIGLVVSPPLLALINQYISCVNGFVTTLCLQSFLDVISLQTLWNVKSNLKSSKNLSNVAVYQDQPLINFSINTSVTSHILFQALNAISIPCKDVGRKNDNICCSVLTFHSTGIEMNSLLYREGHGNSEERNNGGDIQVCHKVAGEVNISVLELGLFVHNLNEQGISVNSFLNFNIVMPPSSHLPRMIDICEGRLRQLNVTVAAIITESDRKITPILTWDHIENHLLDVSATCQTNDSDFNNSLVLQVKIPSIEMQVGKPSHGIASEKDLFVDPAIFMTFVQGWKPMLDKVIKNLQNTQINKIIFEKELLLRLLKSAQEVSVKQKVLNPLLTDESVAVQNCVSFLLLRQLWNGLPQTKKESNKCSVKSNIIDKEIISISYSVALVVLSDQISHGSSNNGGISSHQAALVSSYHSISPSPSGLGIPNVAFVDQIGSSFESYSKNMSYSHFVLLRESLLPIYKVCNMKVMSQVMRSGQDSSKLSIDYYLKVKKLSIMVSNNEVSPVALNVKKPELLIEHFYVSGSLDYVAKLCNLERKVYYVVTIPQNQGPRRSLNCNVVSKCSLNFDSLLFHITLPMLMVVRHTTQSFRHVKDLFVDIEVTLPLVKKYEEEAVTCDRRSNVTEFTSYLCAFERTALSSCRTDFGQVFEQFDTCNNPGKSFSEVHVDTSDLSQSSLMSEHLDSPVEEPANCHLLSSSSPYDADVVEDTTDSPQFFSSDPEAPVQSSMATYGASKSTLKMSSNDVVENEQLDLSISPSIKDMLNIDESNLDFSIFGSVKVSKIQVYVGIESLLVLCEMHEISGAVDCRTVSPKSLQSHSRVPLSYKVLPSYFSLASTLKKFVLSAQDHAISNNDLGNVKSENLEFCTSICYLKEYVAPAYRCLVQFPGILLDMKQPPIVLHKKLNKYIPTFSAIYEDIFASSPDDSFVDDAGFVGTTPTVSVAELQFPPHIPKGSALFFLKKFKIIVRPLPSLMVSYDITPVVAQIGSTTVIKLMLSIGQHKLEFNSKEYKDDLSLRPIPLPVVLLRGKITPRPHSRLPSVTLEISVKQVVIEVTTNVLNQLLILQTAFIKETNELFNMFMNIGESIPQDSLNAINLAQPADTGFELISLLNSVKLSMQGVKITVSTPLLTAVRFSTGNKIEMLITNVSHQHDTHILANKNHLTLHGKVETEINVALGCIQGGQNVEEEEDDFVELAYFKTWIAFRNTLQQNNSKTDLPVMSDIFLISIYSPHLYIQSTAVEKAILFWVNCKSVYNFWQNEHHQLNTEVQAATEAFVGRLTKPAVQIKAPSIDFSKPRLVQITVSDVGACMPLVHLQTTPHASQKGFPAVVLTIKEMYVSLNFSKKLVSAGRFTGFLVRFDEQFHFRHKTWTVDPKKHKFLNHGIVPSGTYKLCIVNKNDLEENEKLFTAFKWHMSGINVYASTDIGRHISTLVRTLTIIGSDLEEADSEVLSAPGESKPLHKRAFSVSSKTFVDEQETLRAMEWDLARQTRKLNKMRQTGVAPDNLKYEEDTFHKIEMDLVRELRRVFRKGKGFSFQHIGQILSPRSAGLSGPNKKLASPSSTLPRNRLASVTETEPEKLTASVRSHSRHRSDISPTVLRLIKLNEGVSLDDLPVVEEEVSNVADVTCSASEHVKSEPLIPLVNIEINVTISVDSGSIVLQNEDVKSCEHRGPVSQFSTDSPFLSSTRRDKVKSSIDTVLLIPALLVKAHYQNIIGHSFVSAHLSPSKLKYDQELNENDLKTSPDDSSNCNKSVKKGILLISMIISPLPHDLELHPSLLDFVEQVVRPINLNIIPQKNETDDEDDEDLFVKESSLITSQSSVHSLSFPVDVNITFTIHPSKIYLTCNPHAHVKCLMEIPTVNFAISFSLFERKQFERMPVDGSIASSTIPDDTLILNNLHITGCFKTFALVMYTPSPSVQASTVHDDTLQRGYKEAFNLVLGQAFIHLSRKSVHENVLCKASDSICVQEKLKVSVIPVVESLLLTFDWRRLNDITWFRKCWYHNGLMEALFTGHKPIDDVQQVDVQRNYDLPMQKSGSNDDLNPLYNASDTVTAEIVVAVSIVDLRVYANMAQFMGNAHILLSHVHGICHADVHQNKLILLMCNGGIEEIDFTAEGGVVAGDLTMKMLQLHVLTSSQEDSVPEHSILINLSILQGHIDYMSAHILLLRIVDTCVEACDTWSDFSQDDFAQQSSLGVEISAKLKWTTFQLAMHRSTAAAAFGIAQRMYDFVMQQKKRSERTIGLMIPPGTAASTAFAAYQEDQKRAEKSSIDSPFLEYHHWMWAVNFGNTALLKGLTSLESYDDCNISLGGKIDISGNNFCLVCFHGTSFRETEWATLNIDCLGGQFSTIAIPGLGELNEVHKSDVPTRICSQSCKIFLGQNISNKSELAAIYRVSVGRGGIPPISHKEIAEWLHYACIHHYTHSSEDTSGHGKLFFKQSQKLTVQHVIGFPALNVTIINDHFWPSLDILLKCLNSVNKPLCTVECSVFSSFSESIAVTTAVENYLFLHDLFKGYIDHLEEQKISFRPPFSGIQSQASELSNENLRNFVNIHWDVEPHILLMGKSTWASGQINPHISWLLEKLGLDHARTTIPKYVQRGLLDPIDLAIATTLELLLTLSRKQQY